MLVIYGCFSQEKLGLFCQEWSCQSCSPSFLLPSSRLLLVSLLLDDLSLQISCSSDFCGSSFFLLNFASSYWHGRFVGSTNSINSGLSAYTIIRLQEKKKGALLECQTKYKVQEEIIVIDFGNGGCGSFLSYVAGKAS